MAMGEFDYYRLLQAVENYYGTGSDQWAALATGSATAAERAAILRQVPGVTTTVNGAGEIMSWSLEATPSTMTAAETSAAAAAQSINSNAVTVAVKELSVPGNAVLNETTGVIEMSSGATRVAGAGAGSKVATVAGHVGTWVVGAGVGLKLGVYLNSLLYNINPDFWDHNTWGPVNPELWKSTKITNWLYDYSGYEDFMGMVDDEGQLYIDENVLALAAQYLTERGAFNTPGYDVTIDDDSALFNPGNYILPLFYQASPILYMQGSQGLSNFTVESSTAPVYGLVVANEARTQASPIFWSEEPFTWAYNYPPNGHQIIQSTYVEKDGIGFYVGSYYYFSLSDLTPYSVVRTFNTHVPWDIAYICKYGDSVQRPTVPGIIEYALTPQGIVPGEDPADTINRLKQQYPEIWNPTDPTQPGPIKQGVLQDDGTITDKIYIPIPTPDGGEEGQPETTPDTPIKPNPDNEPSTKTIIKIVQPTPTPTPPEPDTGEGNTPVAPAPTGSADALYKIYNPSNAQIQSFGAWLWSSNFVDQLLKVFNDPMQAIISLHKIYAAPHTGGTANIKVGYLDSGVSSKWVDQQYIDVDCGSVNVFEISGNVIDYMCDIRIYLPFIGIVTLDVNDVMRGVVGVKYRIDVITGTCVAFVSITRDAGAGGVIYQYTGSMAEIYPLSSGSYMGIITGVLGIAAGIAGTIATGGAAAPALIGGAAGLTQMHTKVEHSNGFSGNAGALAAKKPYLIISRPQSAMSNGIGNNKGWPANYYVKLSQCTGYTRVSAIHLSGINATDSELDQIESLLKEGVII